jgi:hypothetical protein
MFKKKNGFEVFDEIVTYSMALFGLSGASYRPTKTARGTTETIGKE